jgi:hypothetical protein
MLLCMAHEEIKCEHPSMTLLGWNEKHNQKTNSDSPKTNALQAEDTKKIHHRQIRLASMATMTSIGESDS